MELFTKCSNTQEIAVSRLGICFHLDLAHEEIGAVVASAMNDQIRLHAPPTATSALGWQIQPFRVEIWTPAVVIGVSIEALKVWCNKSREPRPYRTLVNIEFQQARVSSQKIPQPSFETLTDLIIIHE